MYMCITTKENFRCIRILSLHFLDYNTYNAPVETLGFKTSIGPPYPHARRKRRLKWGGFSEYCEIIYFRGAQFSWIHENVYIRGDVISWVGWLV